MTEYHFKLQTVDNRPITELTEVNALKVKTYKMPIIGQDILYWYKLEDIPNPGQVMNPGILMHVTEIEEIGPNAYIIKDWNKREFILKTLYVSDGKT